MRYILDERVGCAAVIDTHHPDYDPEYPGLHSDTGGVVLYEGFTNQSRMNISEGEIEDAKRVIERLKKACDALNDKKPRTKTEFVKCEYSREWKAVRHYNEVGELFVVDCNGNYTNVNDISGAWYEVVCKNYKELYIKVETEIDERQEFIGAYKNLASVSMPLSIDDWAGLMYDSGEFKLVEK